VDTDVHTYKIRDGQQVLKQRLSSTFALFGTRRTPCFPGFPRRAARVFENPREITGVQKVEIAEFSRIFWAIGLRERAIVELRKGGRDSKLGNPSSEPCG
jgi:hypothetical protein